METCAELDHGEILNGSHPQWPLLEGVIYGDATLFINGKPFIEGLVAAETLSAVFEKYLSKESL